MFSVNIRDFCTISFIFHLKCACNTGKRLNGATVKLQVVVVGLAKIPKKRKESEKKGKKEN